ncbi:hypothetical protein FH972_000085 [Carpinus fangiana]|uniref:Uncharacterized protein n=1 Tax=Carpinus fangiana TaxID=176857 RepID=A0A5N6Q822_9ROSI|nr:hypothetical protein FH972_000085 [Carpinus fangiana]
MHGPHDEVSKGWQEIEHLTDALAVHLPRPTTTIVFPRALFMVAMVAVPTFASMPMMVDLMVLFITIIIIIIIIIIRWGRRGHRPQGEPGTGVVGERKLRRTKRAGHRHLALRLHGHQNHESKES